MSVSRCLDCQQIRPPNAAFCPACGASFDGKVPPGANNLRMREVDLTFATAVKLGAGIAVGMMVVGFAVWFVLAVLVLIGLNLPAVPR